MRKVLDWGVKLRSRDEKKVSLRSKSEESILKARTVLREWHWFYYQELDVISVYIWHFVLAQYRK